MQLLLFPIQEFLPESHSFGKNDIQNKYSRDPDKLAARKSASHTERAPKKQKPDDTTPPSP